LLITGKPIDFLIIQRHKKRLSNCGNRPGKWRNEEGRSVGIRFMKLPNGDRADIPLEKLLNYCLNPNHPSGKYKAPDYDRVVLRTLWEITSDNPNPRLVSAFIK
jgi:hypothetical protein